MENNKMYVFGHAYGDTFSNQYDKILAVYKSKNDAKAHLAMIFDKLIKYQNAGKCANVELADNYVECEDLYAEEDGAVMRFDYDRWYIVETPVWDTVPEKIEL